MRFLQVWALGYIHPRRAFQELRHQPAPQWGLYAALLRALGIVVFSYVPAIAFQHPAAPPSYITLFPTEQYYAILLLLAPVVHLGSWLMLSALTHLILRLMRRESNFDLLLNIHGMAALMVWLVLQIFDWITLALGWRDAIFLGISHAFIDVTLLMFLIVIAYRQLMGLSIRLGIGLVLIQLAIGIPIAALFLRMP
ncbi:MAG: hypothetical protein JNM70_22080 [Anaerolineae bacterium]|nr:hypothetical protein [Anaerolineae bacterium]